MKKSELVPANFVAHSFGLMILKLLNNVSLLIIGLTFFDAFGLESAGLVLLLILWCETTGKILKSVIGGKISLQKNMAFMERHVFGIWRFYVSGSVIFVVILRAIYLNDIFSLFIISTYFLVDVFWNRRFVTTPRNLVVAAYFRSSRYILSACVYWVLIGIGFITVENMATIIFAPLVIFVLVRWGIFSSLPNQENAHGENPIVSSSLASFVFSRMDILVVPIFLDMQDSGVYLIARTFSMTMLPLLNYFLNRGKSVLVSSLSFGGKFDFIESTAMLNLGIFLIGGGCSMIPLGLGKIYAPVFGDEQQLFSLCVFLFVASHYCKSLLGACEEILELTAGRKELITLISIAVLLFLAFCFYPDDLQVRSLALAASVMHVGLAVVLAIIVAFRFGIWPGPTALLFGQIRLFR
ncbi:hypothetical protein SAMN04488040_2220 [Sulfitobacter marinus]|uniref:Uncharacterized protein n=1 Tax=Sulfitobacter marinus TaxID=394264 RepID=A0A1I6TFI6_9RHOB|nr:hypothetical protein [Sulfitobacter marinus]SFS87797.1 hypothetical protein SAMN04488040_2220 [Sulfitobacter marinus]